MTGSGQKEFYGLERLLAFSDGVFAVAITLLVIDLRMAPAPPGEAATLSGLLAMQPKLLIFAFTFIIIGITWLAHHRKFSYIHQADGALLRLNLLYLLTICLVPFASGVLSDRNDHVAFVLYCVVLMVVSLLSAALSAYGLRAPYLGTRPLRRGVRQDLILSPFFTAVVFMVAIGLSLGGREQMANWSLLLIIPASAYFGRQSRKGE